MRVTHRRFTNLSLGAVLLLQAASAQQPNQAKGIQRPPDPRVQQRTYHFKDTNEDLPYAVYVSSKGRRTRKTR